MSAEVEEKKLLHSKSVNTVSESQKRHRRTVDDAISVHLAPVKPMENFAHIYLSMVEAAVSPSIAPSVTVLAPLPAPSVRSTAKQVALDQSETSVEDDGDRHYHLYPTLYL